MQILIQIILFLFISISLNAQTIWEDTAKTTVNLKKFKLSNKIVIAEYGKVFMYFNQVDYLKHTDQSDTVRITPKYFSDHTISHLLKKGKVKIVRRSNNEVETKITHRLKQYGSMCDRIFEFEDGIGFFRFIEVVGIMNSTMSPLIDSTSSWGKHTIIPTKKFAYKEDTANLDDTVKIKIKNYFPFKEFSHYVYSNNNDYGELDTIVCKSAILNNQTIFYFADCFNKYKVVSIGTTMFGPGVYFYRNDSLFAIQTDCEDDIKAKKINNASLLLPSHMSCGDSITFNYGLEKKIFTYLFQEDIKTDNYFYIDCAKFKIIEQWPDVTYIGYVWLKKDVGMVKWMRSTGRIDELVSPY